MFILCIIIVMLEILNKFVINFFSLKKFNQAVSLKVKNNNTLKCFFFDT